MSRASLLNGVKHNTVVQNPEFVLILPQWFKIQNLSWFYQNESESGIMSHLTHCDEMRRNSCFWTTVLGCGLLSAGSADAEMHGEALHYSSSSSHLRPLLFQYLLRGCFNAFCSLTKNSDPTSRRDVCCLQIELVAILPFSGTWLHDYSTL